MPSDQFPEKQLGRLSWRKCLAVVRHKVVLCSFLSFSILFIHCQASAAPTESQQGAVTFVQITDSHIFDSGKERKDKNQSPKDIATEIASSWLAWDWSILEINQLDSRRPLDFVVFTGDFGLEKVSNLTPVPPECIGDSVAEAEVARSFALLPVKTIYVVRGNNDLDNEDPDDTYRFDNFVKELGDDPLLKGKKEIFNLTRDGHSGYRDIPGHRIRLIGLDSSTYKKPQEEPGNPQHKCDYKPPKGESPPPPLKDREKQMKEIADGVKEFKGNVLLFTHIPDLDDPYDVDDMQKHPEKWTDNDKTPAAWKISPPAREVWKDIVAKPEVVAIFAGHLHDSRPETYLQPFIWQSSRTSNLLGRQDAIKKTFLAPPLAAKFQMDTPTQARGLRWATLDESGAVNSEIVWFSPQSIGALIGPAPEREHSACVAWLAALAGFLAGVLLVVVICVLKPAAAKSPPTVRPTRPGTEAAFRQAALKAAWPRQTHIVRADDDEPEDAQAKVREINKSSAGQPIVLTLTEGGEYEADFLKEIIDNTSTNPAFLYIAVLGVGKDAISYIEVSTLRKNLERTPGLLEGFVKAVSSNAMKEYPGVVTETVLEGTSNLTALEKMERLRLDAILTIDKEGVPKWVVERQSIVDQLIAASAKA